MSPAAAARSRRQAHFCRDRDAEGQPPGPQGPDRRAFLSLLGGGLAAGGALLREARAAEDQTLQALIEQNQRRELGQDFDSASRTIHMPRASLPTLSPSTVDTTAQQSAATRRSSPAAAGRRCRRSIGCGSATAIRAWWRCAKLILVGKIGGSFWVNYLFKLDPGSSCASDWLLRDTPGGSRQQIDAMIKSGERQDARLKKPVPVFWVYITAWATPDNVVQFRDDTYNRDLGPYATTFKG